MQSQQAVTEVHDTQAQEDWAKVRDSGVGEMLATYNLVHALSIVDRCGMGRKLVSNGGCRPDRLVEGLDPAMAAGLLDYLSIRGIVTIGDDLVVPTPRGRALLAEVPMALLGYFHESYAPVFREGAGLLDGTRTYGTDIERDGEALGRHCEVLFRSFGTSVVMEMLEAMGARCLLDLGCGTGGLLMDVCRVNPDFRGIGLDNSPEVVRYGQARVAEAGLAHRVQVLEGDAFLPDTWPDACAEADAILIVGTLHEHFRCGEQAVVDVLNRYAEFLGESGRGLILAEPELYRDAVDADFYLAHTFTRQGYPRRREDWFALFERSGLRCEQMVQLPGTGFRFMYFHMVRA